MEQDLHRQAGAAIEARRGELAEAVTARHYARRPELAARYGAVGRIKCLEDAHFHLSYLAEAVAAASPPLFADYVAWARVMLAGRGIPAEDLAENLAVLREALVESFPGELWAAVEESLAAGLDRLRSAPSELPPRIGGLGGGRLAGLAGRYLEALLAGDRQEAGRMVLAAAEGGVPVQDLYLGVFQPSQYEIGRLWQMNRISVAQEHFCTAATQLILSRLHPYVFTGERNGRTLVAACVSGDLHEVGARMVSDFFEMAGWNTCYLGANTPTPSLVQIVEARRADVLAVSATLPSHVSAVARLIAAVRESPAGARTRILVGGYPFNVDPDLWRRVGADAYALDAREAVAVAERLVRETGGRTPAAPGVLEEPAAPEPDSRVRDDYHYDDLTRLNNELATAQRELAKKNAELARLNEQKNQFLGIAAHDLRNPLGVIEIYSHFLLEGTPGLCPEQAGFVRKIRSSSEYMVRLIDNLLDYAKIEAGRLELDLERIDLAALVARNVELNRLLAAPKGTAIHLDLGSERMELMADAAKLEQVLNNLIGNAVKFSPPGSAVAVAVRVAAEDGGFGISVADQGPGIPSEELADLFRPFRRGSVRATGGEKRTGLGLAIVKNIVAGHGGEIRVESEEGKGTVFRVALPPVVYNQAP
jgi:signal transduction histidine kinase